MDFAVIAVLFLTVRGVEEYQILKQLDRMLSTLALMPIDIGQIKCLALTLFFLRHNELQWGL